MFGAGRTSQGGRSFGRWRTSGRAGYPKTRQKVSMKRSFTSVRSNGRPSSRSMEVIFSSGFPHGLMVSNQWRSVFTFNAMP